MCIKKIISFNKRYRERCRNFHSSSIAGLFTGVMIGILFNLITDSQFNRWINFLSFEIFAAAVYVFLVVVILYIFYFIGKGVFWVSISKKKKELIGFKINYVAGIYSASFGALLIFLKNERLTAIYAAVILLLLYLPVEYYAVRTKRTK